MNTSTTISTTPSGFSTFWSTIPPLLVEAILEPEKVILVYREQNMVSGNFGPFPDRVYKIEYSCKEGKWHESERIYGTIIPPTPEQYEFEN